MWLALLLNAPRPQEILPSSLVRSQSIVHAWANACTVAQKKQALKDSDAMYRELGNRREHHRCVVVETDGKVEAVGLLERTVDGSIVLKDVACNKYDAGTRLVKACVRVPAVQLDASIDPRWQITAAFFSP